CSGYPFAPDAWAAAISISADPPVQPPPDNRPPAVPTSPHPPEACPPAPYTTAIPSVRSPRPCPSSVTNASAPGPRSVQTLRSASRKYPGLQTEERSSSDRKPSKPL